LFQFGTLVACDKINACDEILMFLVVRKHLGFIPTYIDVSVELEIEIYESISVLHSTIIWRLRIRETRKWIESIDQLNLFI
jgi:hypothetical protein